MFYEARQQERMQEEDRQTTDRQKGSGEETILLATEQLMTGKLSNRVI